MTVPSLDVLLGLITVYIVLALTVSAATEVLSRIVGLRSIGLRSGIRSILDDPALKAAEQKATKAFWASGIVKSVTDGDARPTSLDALTFATATLSTFAGQLPRDNGQVRAEISELPLNEHLKQVLLGLTERAVYRGTSLHDELAQHFDATMDKVSRWYRHWTHAIAFLFAVLLTVYINANTLDFLRQLTAHPEARLELAKVQLALSADHRAERSVSPGSAADNRAASSTAAGRPRQNAERVEELSPDAETQLGKAYNIIARDELGTGFNAEALRTWHGGLGLLITILAVSLGAPFWFDVLGRITQKSGRTDQPVTSVSPQPLPAVPAPKTAAPAVKPDQDGMGAGADRTTATNSSLTAP